MVTALQRAYHLGQNRAPQADSTSTFRRLANLPEVQRSQGVARGGLDGFVLNVLQPPRLPSELLEPGRFQNALKAGRVILENASVQSHAPTASLNRAARILSDEIELRALMMMYRSSLLQG